MIGRLAALAAAAIAVAQAGGTPAPARPRVTGIDHAAFRVTDAGSARAYYAGMLGLDERPSRDRRIIFAVGSRQRIVLEPGLPLDQDERLSHLAFSTPDLKALDAWFRSHGVDVTQPADRCAPSAIRVTDPDGHAIEFIEAAWPPPIPDARPARALARRLLHAGLTVRDEQAAQRFYRDVLGFSEVW